MHQRHLIVRIATAFLTLLLCATALQAQLRLTIDTLDARLFPDIRMKVRVQNGAAAVRGLTVANFTVLEQGAVMIPIAGYCEDTVSTGPVSVLLVIDVSRSMGPWPIGSNSLPDAKNAAKSFVDRLGTSDEAALLSFSDQPYYNQSWTQNHTLLKQKIDALSIVGGTAIWDAVYMGSTIINDRTKRRVMIVLTDGQDGSSARSLSEAIAAARGANATVYTIGLGPDIDESGLQQLGAQTGGQYFRAPGSSDLDRIYFLISQEISSTGVCELRYRSPITCHNGSVVQVEAFAAVPGGNPSGRAQYTLPYDTTTFSYLSLAVNRDIIVEHGQRVSVPLNLTRITTNRPQNSFQFDLRFDTDLLTLERVDTTALTAGYTTAITPTGDGARVVLQGARALSATGPVLTLTFAAKDVYDTRKSPVSLSQPQVTQFCTVTSSSDGLVTVSGRCERALLPDTALHAQTASGPALLNAPNPFNPGTWVRYRLDADGPVRITVHDALGRAVAVLRDEVARAGAHALYFDGGNLPAGAYLLRLETPDAVRVRRMVLLK